MPHIDISMFAGRDDETKKKVAEAVVETMMKELGCQRNHLSVAIHDYDPAEWNENEKVGSKVDKSKLYAGEVFENK
jgi:phenylpyruvate tautomerase PptA (4-oxalocrotonate tautomerase family)